MCIKTFKVTQTTMAIVAYRQHQASPHGNFKSPKKTIITAHSRLHGVPGGHAPARPDPVLPRTSDGNAQARSLPVLVGPQLSVGLYANCQAGSGRCPWRRAFPRADLTRVSAWHSLHQVDHVQYSRDSPEERSPELFTGR